jgi:predicted transposase YbfD/YdcC
VSRPDVAFVRYFADLPDPRVNRTRLHLLSDILVIAVCAVIAGADTFEGIETFGKARRDWLRRFLRLPHGIPSHDTFNRVLAALDRKRFAECFGRWMAALCAHAGLKQVAVDGKAVRAAPGDTFSGCLHLVSAWAVQNRLILGQEAVADGSHEIAAIPELLKVLDLKGALVSIDAAGCQVEIARQIREQKGHYLLAVKGNQPSLQEAVGAAFDRAIAADFAGVKHAVHLTEEEGHGRREGRYVTVLYRPEGLPSCWPDVAAAVLVSRERIGGGKVAGADHYYITSYAGSAARLAEHIRGHWGVENDLHWTLDISFREDANRTRDRNAGANLGVVRRVAASLLKQDPGRGSIKNKRLKAALDEDYLLTALQGFPEI